MDKCGFAGKAKYTYRYSHTPRNGSRLQAVATLQDLYFIPARTPRKPITPTAVPRMKDVTARARWTQKYAVGLSASSKASPLASLNRFFAKVTQITQDQTPKASRNQETRRLSFMGCPSEWDGRALPVSNGPTAILRQGLCTLLLPSRPLSWGR